MALLRAREAVMAHFRPIHRERKVTEQQWRVIRALYEYGDMDVTALAEQTFLHMPSLSRILRDMVKRRLVSRQPSPEDQRRFIISLSASGRRLIEATGSLSEEQYRLIEKKFGRQRLEELYELLDQLEEIVGATKS